MNQFIEFMNVCICGNSVIIVESNGVQSDLFCPLELSSLVADKHCFPWLHPELFQGNLVDLILRFTEAYFLGGDQAIPD